MYKFIYFSVIIILYVIDFLLSLYNAIKLWRSVMLSHRVNSDFPDLINYALANIILSTDTK